MGEKKKRSKKLISVWGWARREALSSRYHFACPTALNIILDILIVHCDRGVRDKLSHFSSQLMCSIFPPPVPNLFFWPPFSFFGETHSCQLRVGHARCFNSSKQPLSHSLNVMLCLKQSRRAGHFRSIDVAALLQRTRLRWHWSWWLFSRSLRWDNGHTQTKRKKGQERD